MTNGREWKGNIGGALCYMYINDIYLQELRNIRGISDIIAGTNTDQNRVLIKRALCLFDLSRLRIPAS